MFQESYIRKIAALVGVFAVIALATYAYTTIKESRYTYAQPVIISVQGVGEVFAAPDIATFSFTVEAKDKDAVTAQNKYGETMDTVLAYLKESGVEEKDIKTEYYNFGQWFEYEKTTGVCTVYGCPPSGEQKLMGYQVSQSVTVKVRDTEKAGELLAGVASKGAINVSGLSFTIDDEDGLMAEAREKAIIDAKEKAKVLADNLGSRIVRMSSFSESQGGYPMFYAKDMDVAMSESAGAPRAANIPMGENTITSTVHISYEIR